ncbi:MAG: shikimate kinase [Caldimonas sp.]
MLISLVGLPGSGKSTIGRRVARDLAVPFFDSDLEVEREAGCSIASFFEQYGEPRFRDLEQAVVARLTEADDAVIATGGGAVLREANRAALRQRSTVVYLDSPIAEILRRIGRVERRPLLAGEEKLEVKLNRLLTERDALYRQTAHLVVFTGRHSSAAAAGLVASRLREIRQEPQRPQWGSGGSNGSPRS